MIVKLGIRMAEEEQEKTCFASEEDDEHPCRRSVDVPHVRQLRNWDCGLACVLMVLRTVGVSHCDIHDLEKLCCTTSIWTVDLAYLLHRFSVRFAFFTITLGVNPGFLAEAFYKEHLPDDITRVGRLFEHAFESGINILHRSFSGREISILMLSGKYIVVVLVDKIKLNQLLPKETWIPGCYGGNSDYTGHYIIICGYDACTEEFEIRDPDSGRKCEMVPLESLDEARRSFGTDEDLLLVWLSGEGEGAEDSSPSLGSILLPQFFVTVPLVTNCSSK